ncbi:TetR/AcrR family transcriptional regulator [Undibacterium sp.]|jgi:AcrR family transcriptional regulator|uniref:TetR/AcrR family transcriptional regulator n=1 Tax=Undibacterium sp. TaxID=1914977 RepID=UPI002C3474B6|nr:TetR/AcrR family transcriptional regulator [Undibacterium sp.]HTD04671.1 TetR/AcrR family transcriptional regulator [Undibacterium sp.]
MNAHVLDRRRQKTRSALHAAFLSLLLEQGYDTLKIGDVADRANVGRSTFYEHYRTKHDLLLASIRGPFSILADLVEPGLVTEPVLALLRHFRENQRVGRVLLGWPIRPLLGQTLAGLIVLRLARMPVSQALLPMEVLARQIADAQLALLEIWVLGRPACDINAVAEALKRGTDAFVGALTSGPPLAGT